jgi:hypothetical protein
VFDQSGSPALAITAIGAEVIFDADWESAIAVELRQYATEVSQRSGFSSRPHANDRFAVAVIPSKSAFDPTATLAASHGKCS